MKGVESFLVVLIRIDRAVRSDYSPASQQYTNTEKINSMSAANASVPASSLEEEARAQEPSMEEILASIRRIIADDEILPGARRRVREAPEPAQANAEELAAPAPTDVAAMTRNAYPAPALERREPPVPGPAQLDSAEDRRSEKRREAASVADIRPLRLDSPAPAPVEAEYQLEESSDDEYGEAPQSPELEACVPFAEETDEAVLMAGLGAPLLSSDTASSIAAHFQTLAATMVINDKALLHKYAQEMMRPMLKQWLDDNLPVIVERLVRAEIERVARGGRR